MTTLLQDIGKVLLEWSGRRRPTPRYSFPSNQIITPGMVMKVRSLWNATYVNLHPTHFAVAIAPDGRVINLRGGYNFPLPGGRYTLHYVDKQKRVFMIPRVSETTRDGSQVSLELVITYRVIDPLKALEAQQAVDTLLVFITSDLKEFIRSYNYDELVGDGRGLGIDNVRVSNFIKDKHAGRSQMARLFLIEDIGVEEKSGDPKLSELRGNFQLQQRQNTATGELLKQKQDLEKKVASQEAELRELRVNSDANQQKVQQKLDMERVALERARAQLKYQQEIMTKAMDAIGQAFSSPYPMDPREVEIIKEIIAELRGITGSEGDASRQENVSTPKSNRPANMDRLDNLTKTLNRWLDYKRS